MDQILLSCTSGTYLVDGGTGNVSIEHFSDSNGAHLLASAGPRIFCVPQPAKALLHFFKLTDNLPEGNGNPVYKCSVPEKFTAVCFSSCGGLLFAGSASGTAYVWQTWTGKLLKSWTCHFGQVNKIIVSSDGTHLVTAGHEDATVKIFFLPDVFDSSASDHVIPVPSHTISGHSGSIADVLLIQVGGNARNADRIAVTSVDKQLKVYDLGFGGSQKVVHAFVLGEVPAKLCGTPDGRQLFVGCANGSIWGIASSDKSVVLLGTMGGSITGLGLSLDCSRLYSCSEQEGLKIWDTTSRVLVHAVMGPQQQLKGARGLLVRVKGVSEGVEPRLVQPNLLVSAVDASLQFKPFQRTVTAVQDIDKVPLIRCAAKHSKIRTKTAQAICVNELSVECFQLPKNSIEKLQAEIAQLRELNRVWVNAYANLHAKCCAEAGVAMPMEVDLGHSVSVKKIKK